jgi:aminocarboxymuconate-semialdehyde decarboxylase
MTVIDVHNHVVPAEFPAAADPGVAARWPCMRHGAAGDATVMMGDTAFRAIDDRCWNMPRRLAEMDAEGVDVQVLSPMPELLSYWLPAEHALTIARHVNEAIAGMIAVAPARFAGLGMVPMQDPDLAARELSALKRDHGLAGVEIGSNVNGIVPGDPRFDGFFAEAERLDLAVFIHALHPVATERIVGPPRTAPFVLFPIDTGIAAASLITGGTLRKYPKLRVGFSHGGGVLASILPRLQFGWRLETMLQDSFASPIETARRLFYDNLVYDAATQRHLIATFGASQIFLGSDYPFVARQARPGDTLAELSPAEREAMSSENARRFLGL